MRVMVVDDEVIIREWLQSIIEKNLDWEYVGCAENGRQALNLLNKLRPDVIFSDIKMPVMDGITMLHEVKKSHPEIHIVLLTAFSEFDLARQAIKEGADDYVLKTEISSAVFPQILGRLQEKIEVHKDTDEESTYRHSMIRDILRKKKTMEDSDWEKLQEYKVRWKDDGLFAIALWKQDVKNKAVFPKMEEVQYVIGLDQDEDIYVLIGNLAHTLSESEKMNTLLTYATLLGKENQCMTGVSSIYYKRKKVNYAIAEAVHALSGGFLLEKKKVYQPVYTGETLFLQCEQWKKICADYFQHFYNAPEKDKFGLLEQLPQLIEQSDILYVEYIKNLLNKILECIGFQESASVELQESTVFSDCYEVLRNAAYLNIWDIKKSTQVLSKNVDKAVAYIQENYGKAISLEEIAEVVGLNPEYLSRTFKEEMGCTYSTFLSEIRLKQAALLLEKTNEKVQKIAEQVGYPNVSYFSTVFKKRFACNPYEYRRNKI